MKANRLMFTVLLLLSAAVFQLRAEQTEINRKQVEELWAKAKAGDADSEFRLGLCYASGQGVAKDYAEAVKWYRKAAEQNDAVAQAELGVSYATGQGVAKDYVEAVKWFRKAAEQTNAFNPSSSPTPAVETKSSLEPKQASERTNADAEPTPSPEPTEDTEQNIEEMNDWHGFSPDEALFAVTRFIPDSVYIQRHDLDGVAVGVFRGEFQTPVVARHDFRGRFIAHIEWSPDSNFLLFTTASSDGHFPYHAAAFVFCAADKSFRNVDAVIGDFVSPKFRFEPPDIAVIEVKKGDKPEEEVKVSLSKIMQQMPRVK